MEVADQHSERCDVAIQCELMEATTVPPEPCSSCPVFVSAILKSMEELASLRELVALNMLKDQEGRQADQAIEAKSFYGWPATPTDKKMKI
eukprot:CAMPEP_0170453922 /NCGR_PEP_ID=MMETSP0123-20130129/2353_1 /TAXON_ID=182087 /ORGANISM="Favella ehrenbergii, Strain Fehren 1" /LENGTH=90 /DNA_ID=CAMNT_0010716477 /DNA_START=286 /DNA_END=558 /DNA_ORIENTATION=+